VQADPGQLHQLLWNLILNSVQAMPDGGEVRVVAAVLEPVAPQASGDMGRNAENKEASVEICVRDTGEGISAEVLERIFDPFFTTKPEGSGLGLATVHRIVEEHGGSLKLESEERRGTTVRVRLPRGETSD
jgi:signal transduction histidine kinase